MITFLRRCYGACLTVLAAVTGTPTQAKHNAADRPRPDCGRDFERHPDPSRPAEEPFNHRVAPAASTSVVDGLVSRGGADRAAQADGSSTATGGAA